MVLHSSELPDQMSPSFMKTPKLSNLENVTFYFIILVKIVKQSETDSLCIITCGVLVHESLKAAEELEAEGVKVRVIDVFSIKPIDVEGLKTNINAVNGKIIVAE